MCCLHKHSGTHDHESSANINEYLVNKLCSSVYICNDVDFELLETVFISITSIVVD